MGTKRKIEMEITGLAVLVENTGPDKTDAQVLWLKGELPKVPKHYPHLVVDVADLDSSNLDEGLPNQVVQLADGRQMLVVDLSDTEVRIDRDRSRVVLEKGTQPLPQNPSQQDWKDFRYVASLELASTSVVAQRFLQPGSLPHPLKGRMTFVNGHFRAAMPRADIYQRLEWEFPGGETQHVTDRIVWNYESPKEDTVIRVFITKKGAESLLVLWPADGDTVRLAANCYPRLGAPKYEPKNLENEEKSLEWDDFACFYEILEPAVPLWRLPSANIAVTVKEKWCPGVRARA